MTMIGYARVSSIGQSLDVQDAMLREAGCTKLFTEKKSGRKASDRQALQDALEWVRKGDTFVVTRLDRLARSVIDLHQIVAKLTAKGVEFLVLQQSGIDTTRPEGKMLLTMLGAVAEFETDIRAERQKDGIEAAKAKGVYKGRPATIDPTLIMEALGNGEAPSAIAKRLNIARSTVYRLKDATPA